MFTYKYLLSYKHISVGGVKPIFFLQNHVRYTYIITELFETMNLKKVTVTYVIIWLQAPLLITPEREGTLD